MAARCDRLSRSGSCRERRGRTVQPIGCGGERSRLREPRSDRRYKHRGLPRADRHQPVWPDLSVEGCHPDHARPAAKFGVEGFSEVMVTELAPLGVKVTIFEPGGFRTDFAGSSQTIDKIRPEYDATVGQAARFQRDYNGKQPGDPARAAQVILKVVRMDDPPIRLLLGSDALNIVQTADARKAAADRKWSALSASTDFVAAKT